jgi:hypothetical protein
MIWSKRVLLVVLLAIVGAESAIAQTSTGGTTGPQSTVAVSDVTETVLDEINTTEAKMVKAAEDFPEGLYNTYRPVDDKDLSTVAEMLLEVADFDATSAFQMSTKQQQRAMKKPDDKDYDFQSKADTVLKVKQSFATLRKAIQDNPDPKNLQDWLFVISFSNQLYGRIRIYCNMNGLLVP